MHAVKEGRLAAWGGKVRVLAELLNMNMMTIKQRWVYKQTNKQTNKEHSLMQHWPVVKGSILVVMEEEE